MAVFDSSMREPSGSSLTRMKPVQWLSDLWKLQLNGRAFGTLTQFKDPRILHRVTSVRTLCEETIIT